MNQSETLQAFLLNPVLELSMVQPNPRVELEMIYLSGIAKATSTTTSKTIHLIVNFRALVVSIARLL